MLLTAPLLVSTVPTGVVAGAVGFWLAGVMGRLTAMSLAAPRLLVAVTVKEKTSAPVWWAVSAAASWRAVPEGVYRKLPSGLTVRVLPSAVVVGPL